MSADRSRDSKATAADKATRKKGGDQAGKDAKKKPGPVENEIKRAPVKKVVAQPIETGPASVSGEEAGSDSSLKPSRKRPAARKTPANIKSAAKAAPGKKAVKKTSPRKAASKKPAASKQVEPSAIRQAQAESDLALNDLLIVEAGARLNSAKSFRASREISSSGSVYPSEKPPLEAPVHYGRSRVVLMARDSHGLYAYWEVSAIDRGRHRIGQPQGPCLLLRIHDLGEGPFISGGMRGSDHDVVLGQYETHAFLEIPVEGRCWYCEFGLLAENGDFLPLATSNAVKTPRRTPPEIVSADDEVWMMREYQQSPTRPGAVSTQWRPPMAEGSREEIFSISGGYQALHAHVEGSRQPAPVLRLPMAFPMGASEQLPIPGVPTGAPVSQPTSGAIGQKAVHLGRRGFWLNVNTELIVYGQTEPDARLTIQGLPVPLERDGSFRIQFSLPDGEQVIPIVARSADGEQSRSATPVVKRRTEDIDL